MSKSQQTQPMLNASMPEYQAHSWQLRLQSAIFVWVSVCLGLIVIDLYLDLWNAVFGVHSLIVFLLVLMWWFQCLITLVVLSRVVWKKR